MLQAPQPILVSACLLGLRTRYDGKTKQNATVLEYLQKNQLVPVPVCPEQLAGLPTPRKATRFARGNGEDVLTGCGAVETHDGADRTALFIKGAEQTLQIARLAHCKAAILKERSQTLQIARLAHCKAAILKERSPSCGVHQIYLGAEIVPGSGVASALLKRTGIQVYNEDDLPPV